MTARRKPPNRRNPPHNVGAPEERWERFGRQCERLGTDRTKELNRFMAWMNHEPSAPKRLTRPPLLDDHADEQTPLADDEHDADTDDAHGF